MSATKPPQDRVVQVLTLAEAESRLLAAAIPEVERRIDRSFLTSLDAVEKALMQDGEGESRLIVRGRGMTMVCISDDAEDPSCPDFSWPGRLSGRGLIIVAVSDRWVPLFQSSAIDSKLGFDADGMASGPSDGKEGSYTWHDWLDPSGGPPDRKRFLVAFDAGNGDELGVIASNPRLVIRAPTARSESVVRVTAPASRHPDGNPSRTSLQSDIVRVGAVHVPAGTFHDCAELHRQYSAAITAVHWLCPGIGLVRSEIPEYGSMSIRLVVDELVEFSLPAIAALP